MWTPTKEIIPNAVEPCLKHVSELLLLAYAHQDQQQPHPRPECPERNSEQPRSVALDVAEVLVRQFPDSGWLDGVSGFFAVAHAGRGVGLHQARGGEGVQVPVQAWAADGHHGLQPADYRRAQKRQVAQDVGLGPVAHEADGSLDLRGEFWSDEAWHGSILPDAAGKQSFSSFLALLIINRASGMNRGPA
jgi:hypothetical protein